MSARRPTVRFENVTLGYARHPAVHHLQGSFAPGSLTALVGPNGAGKSTLLKGIIGSLRPLEGRIVLEHLRRRDIAYLPQQAEIDRSFPLSVIDLVCLGLWREIGLFAAVGKSRLARAEAALATVGLAGFEARPIATLSGGQMQRALFARMMLQDAPIMLLDEPFNAIDSRTVADLFALVRRWHGEARTIVAVLHDLDIVRAHFPETLLLARSPVDWGPTARVLSADNLLKARRLSEAWDEHAHECDAATAA